MLKNIFKILQNEVYFSTNIKERLLFFNVLAEF